MYDIAKKIKESDSYNLTDINVICEDIFGQLLNKIYGYNLSSMTATVSGNFAAVDLVDLDNRIAYQVTSRHDKDKITSTIEKFNKSDLITQVDNLYILVLGTTIHKYKLDPKEKLLNGQLFEYNKDVINLTNLFKIIQKESESRPELIAESYEILSMVYDSGRLEYLDIVEYTRQLRDTYNATLLTHKVFKQGYGDVQISAFIPLIYGKKLSCLIFFRKHNINGAYITLSESDLIQDFFVSETEFIQKHSKGRFCDEDETWFEIKNVRFLLNAHTAYHIYLIFKELELEYQKANEYICNFMGCFKLKLQNGTFYITTIRTAP